MLTQPNLRRVHLHKMQGGQPGARRIFAVEEPLEIRLAFEREGEAVARSISVTMRTPGEILNWRLAFCLTRAC